MACRAEQKPKQETSKVVKVTAEPCLKPPSFAAASEVTRLLVKRTKSSYSENASRNQSCKRRLQHIFCHVGNFMHCAAFHTHLPPAYRRKLTGCTTMLTTKRKNINNYSYCRINFRSFAAVTAFEGPPLAATAVAESISPSPTAICLASWLLAAAVAAASSVRNIASSSAGGVLARACTPGQNVNLCCGLQQLVVLHL